MRANWVRFAVSDAPATSWPRYTSEERSTLIIDEVDRVEDDPRSFRRLAWNGFLPHLANPAASPSPAVVRARDWDVA
jgi:para-nitrobenzyl esterase